MKESEKEGGRKYLCLTNELHRRSLNTLRRRSLSCPMKVSFSTRRDDNDRRRKENKERKRRSTYFVNNSGMIRLSTGRFWELRPFHRFKIERIKLPVFFCFTDSSIKEKFV